jgi:membrane-associated phospholipid phosphatase
MFVRSIRAVDVLIIAFTAALSAVAVLFVPEASVWKLVVPLNLGFWFIIIFLAIASNEPNFRLLRLLHDWYPVAAIFLVFKEVYVVIQTIGRMDIDTVLINLDRAIFGSDPTVWISRFSSPLLTEILQIAYVSYYLLMITLAAELYLRKDYDKFHFGIFAFTYGFMLSYLGYIAFPAVGPRFTLHAFSSIEKELPGLYITDFLRHFINAGESIPNDLANPLAVAQRDAFPSGHTQMVLMVLYFATKYRLKSRYVLYVMGTLLIISTVYLRYHYVVDVIGGVVFMAFTVWTAPMLYKQWERLRIRFLGEPAAASSRTG